jgi:hypothetical protein
MNAQTGEVTASSALQGRKYGYNFKVEKMKLEKFDLEKALNGAKVVTRDGKEVKQLTYFDLSDDHKYHLYGVVGKSIRCWTITGQYEPSDDNYDLDLCLAVEPKRIWVNAYYYNGKLWLGGSDYTSLTEAKLHAVDTPNMQYIKTIEITDEL